MNLEDTNHLAQIIAALSVVASLIFVGIQTRQNTKVTRAKASWDAQNSFVAINDQLSDGGVMSEVMFRNASAPDTVTDYEKYLTHRFMRSFFQRLEAQFALYRHGILDEELWSLRIGYGRSVLAIPLVRDIWRDEKRNSMFTSAFIAEIERTDAATAPVFAGVGPLAGALSAQQPTKVADDLETFLDAYRACLRAMANGDNRPAMALYSKRSDVTLANPLGPPIVGYANIATESAKVASGWKNGSVEFEEVIRYASQDHAWIIGFERYQGVNSADGTGFSRNLRATTIVRREDGEWRIALRHADPIGAEPAVFSPSP